jgi:hypothetical protein
VLTREELESLIEAQKYAEEHAPENYMRIEAEFQNLPDPLRCATPKIFVEVCLPTLEEILRGLKTS